MNNECFVSKVDNPTHTVARVEGRRGPGVILNRSVVVAVLNFLESNIQLEED